MAKFWIPGQVKTRLAREIGDQAAALIHRLFTLHLGEQLSLAADYRHVFTAPDQECGNMQAAIGERWIAVPQGNGDLGMRMSRAFQCLLGLGNPLDHNPVVLVFSCTKQVIDDLGLGCGYLGIREDIDTVECLHRLLLSDDLDQELRASIRLLLNPAMNPSQPL